MLSDKPLSTNEILLDCLAELRGIHCVLKRQNNKQARRKSTVNSQVAELLAKMPYQDWTAHTLAKHIGCSDSAVKKSGFWQVYQRQRRGEKNDQIKIQANNAKSDDTDE